MFNGKDILLDRWLGLPMYRHLRFQSNEYLNYLSVLSDGFLLPFFTYWVFQWSKCAWNVTVIGDPLYHCCMVLHK